MATFIRKNTSVRIYAINAIQGRCMSRNIPNPVNLSCSRVTCLLYTVPATHCSKNKLNRVSPLVSRCSNTIKCRYSSRTSDGNDSVSSSDNKGLVEKLPRRVVKRLQKHGLSETEFLSKLNAAELSRTPYDIYYKAGTVPGNEEKLEDMLKNMTTEPGHLSEADNFPSDVKKYKAWKRQQAAAEPKTAPSTTSVLLFPGQGSQFVGMGKNLLDYPGVRDLYEEASAILGYGLLDLCLRGPKTELNKTVHCQPAVMITSLAAIEKCREAYPRAVEKCVTTAGFSVGEFAALVFAGVLSFPDAVRVVKTRAEAMQRASEKIGSGMLTVFLAHDSDLKLAIKTAKEYCTQRRNIENPVCCVANYLFPECKVLAGHEEALEFIATNAKEYNILRTKRLPVSGAFHTRLMESAVQPLRNALEGVKIGNPKILTYSNVTSLPYHPKTNFVHLLSEQLIKPVKWEQIMHEIYSRKQGVEFPNTYEVGPGNQMGTLLKQVNLQAFKQYYSVEV